MTSALSAISLTVALSALCVSGTTLWLSLLRRGVLMMTLPAVVYFGPDGGEVPSLKIYLRALMYSTSKRGWVIEGMYVRIRRGETTQNFNVWVLGERELSRGSGLCVGEVGVATNHHFLLPADGTDFQFLPGNYVVEVYATCVGDRTSKLLRTIRLNVSADHAAVVRSSAGGIYFDWGPDANVYHAHTRLSSQDKPSSP